MTTRLGFSRLYGSSVPERANWRTRVSPLVDRLRRAARSPLLTIALLAASGVFLVVRWRGADWGPLTAADPILLTAGGAIYAAGLAALIGIVADGGRDVVAAGATTQLLKYVPGGVWQGQPLLAAGSGTAVGVFAWGVVVAAGTAATIGLTGWSSAGSAVITIAIAVGGVVRFGGGLGVRRVVFAIAAGFAVSSSGALVSMALDGPGWSGGRAVGLAWAAGVAAVPVPAGLGVREVALSVTGGDGAAVLAASHRLVTLLVDVVVGGFGLALTRRGQ